MRCWLLPGNEWDNFEQFAIRECANTQGRRRVCGSWVKLAPGGESFESMTVLAVTPSAERGSAQVLMVFT